MLRLIIIVALAIAVAGCVPARWTARNWRRLKLLNGTIAKDWKE